MKYVAYRNWFRQIELGPTTRHWGHNQYVGQHSSSSVAQECDALGIPTERRQILLEPVEARHQIHQSKISLGTLLATGLQETKDPQTKVDCHDDDIAVSSKLGAIIGIP